MQSVKNIYLIFNKYSCKGTGFIPTSYRPCPRCGGAGKGIFKDCRLCDDLCYVTEPWIQKMFVMEKVKVEIWVYYPLIATLAEVLAM